MTQNYEDKSRDTVYKDLKNEFKSVENKNGLGFRDDQEIYQAWMNIVDKYLNEIKSDKGAFYWTRALEPLKKYKEELNKKYKECKWWKLLTWNDKLINNISSELDEAENEVLRRLLVNKDYNELKQLQNNSKLIYWKDIFSISNGRYIVFNKESNDKKLLDVIQKVFTNKNQSFEIDYSDCENRKIKEDIKNAVWSYKCWIKYNQKSKQFSVIWKDWIVLQNSPKIWNGVKMITEKSVAITESTINIIQDDSEYAEKCKQLPKKLKDKIVELYWNKWLKKLVEETDKRLDKILKDWIKHNYELHSEATTSSILTWIAEIHFINKNTEEDVKLWENASILWPQMTQTLHSLKKEYIDYVNKRVTEKWPRLKENSHKHKIDIVESGNNDTLNEQEKDQILRWIDFLKTYIANLKKTVWDAKFTWRDKILAEISSIIERLEYGIKSNAKISLEKLKKNVIAELASKWTSFKIKWFKWIMSLKSESEEQKDSILAFEKILLWRSEDDQMIGLRSLSDQEALLDKTESSFLAWNIVTRDDIEINNDYVDSILKNLRERLNVSDNELKFDVDWRVIKNDKIRLIDGLYESSLSWDPKIVANYLCKRWLIPPTHKNNPQIIKWCKEIIQRNLNVIDNIRNSWKIKSSLIERNKKEIHELRLKTNKTEEEIQRLQALEFLDKNKEFSNTIYESLANTIMTYEMYSWVWTTVVHWLRNFFLKFWWWSKWKTWKIVDDIMWIGVFDLTDENSKKFWIVIKEVAILIVTSFLISWALTSIYLKWINKLSVLLKNVVSTEKADWICNFLRSSVELSDEFFVGKNHSQWEVLNRFISKYCVRTPIEWIPLNKFKTSTFRFTEGSRIRTALSAWSDVTYWWIVSEWVDILSSGI